VRPASVVFETTKSACSANRVANRCQSTSASNARRMLFTPISCSTENGR